MDRIYLDHNATTPLDPRVRDAMLEWFQGAPGNPSSPHREGRAARRAVEEAREQVASLLDAEPVEIVFTSGATEANNLAVLGLGQAEGRLPALAYSAIEHPSVRDTARREAARGRTVSELPVDRAGRVDPQAVEESLEGGAGVIALMAANNEVGTLQEIAAVSRVCAARGALLHVDAVQALGKTGFTVAGLGPGSASLSAHKFGGPRGVGALWVRRETPLAPLIVGGGQELGRRAGTENVAAIVGLGAAARLLRVERAARCQALRDAERTFLDALEAAGVSFQQAGPSEAGRRLPGTLSLRFPGVAGETLLFRLDLAGVAASLGAACSSGAAEPSHVLMAMGRTRGEALETLRFSLGWDHPAGSLRDAAARIATALGGILRG